MPHIVAAQRLALPAAGEKQAWKRETAKAQNKLQKSAESQPSGARIVRRVLERHHACLAVMSLSSISQAWSMV